MKNKKVVLIVVVLVIIFIASGIITIALINLSEKNKKNENDKRVENNVSQNENVAEDNKYYLHKSDMESPSESESQLAKAKFFEGVSVDKREEIQAELRIYS